MGQTINHKSPILILGIGNSLLTDDGIGSYVLTQLKQEFLPDYVELLDGGTAGLDLLPHIEDREKVIVIDSVNGGGQPGTLYRFSPENIQMKSRSPCSLHQLGLMEAVQMANLLDRAPREIIIIGIQPKSTAWGLSPSLEVSTQLPQILRAVLHEVQPRAVDLNSHIP